MLPRHLRKYVLTSLTSRQIHNQLHSPSYLAASASRTVSSTNRPVQARIAGFHNSASRQNEIPKSPYQTFVDTLKDELKKNRELLDNVKQLQGDVDKFQDSEAMKRAKAAYERARVRTIIQ